jgi:hypothetical protein
LGRDRIGLSINGSGLIHSFLLSQSSKEFAVVDQSAGAGNQKSAVFFLLDLRENEKSKNYIQKHIKFG